MTFQEYRSVDLMLFAVLTIIFEAIATVASGRWFWAQPVNISVSLLLICIVMIRWGGYAAVCAMTGGVVYCMMSGGEAEQYPIYIIGNLFALAGLFLIKLWGKEALTESKLKLSAYAVLSYIGMAAGRTLVTVALGGPVQTVIVYLTTDVISLLFAIIILILLRKSDGMLEDQKSYLFRLERERKEEAIFDESDHII